MVAFDSLFTYWEGSIPIMKIIEITVAPNGTTSIQTKGYSGADCLSASLALEQALGIKTHEQRTEEYFQSTDLSSQVRSQADSHSSGAE